MSRIRRTLSEDSVSDADVVFLEERSSIVMHLQRSGSSEWTVRGEEEGDALRTRPVTVRERREAELARLTVDRQRIAAARVARDQRARARAQRPPDGSDERRFIAVQVPRLRRRDDNRRDYAMDWTLELVNSDEEDDEDLQAALRQSEEEAANAFELAHGRGAQERETVLAYFAEQLLQKTQKLSKDYCECCKKPFAQLWPVGLICWPCKHVFCKPCTINTIKTSDTPKTPECPDPDCSVREDYTELRPFLM